MNKNIFTCLIVIAIFLASCRKDATFTPVIPELKPPVKPVSTQSSFKVIGYLPSWSGEVAAVQFSKLTHINYSFLIPVSDGSYSPIDNSAKLSAMVTAAHAASVKAIIAVGGGGGGTAFSSIVVDQQVRTTFVNNMLNFLNQYNLDGIDIDWEYPNTGTEANNFFLLLQQLSTALHSKGKILSIAVIGNYGDSIIKDIFSLVDYLEIMAYDDNNFQHSTYQLGVDCTKYWVGRGVPSSKAILGVPFYGHDSSKSESDVNNVVNYNMILQNGGDPKLDVFGTIGYNGISTIKNKTSYIMANGGGIAIWELSGDATGVNSLLSAIDQVRMAGIKSAFDKSDFQLIRQQ